MISRFRTPLAWLILTEQRGPFLLAVARIAFAVLLMFSQLGFLNGVFDSQAELIEHLNADLFIVNRSRYYLGVRERFPRRRVWQALDVPGVSAAFPLYIEDANCNLRNPADGQQAGLRVLAFNPRDPVFRTPEVERYRTQLQIEDTALIDHRAREFFGAVGPDSLSELNGRRIHILDQFQLGADFQNDGNLIMSDVNFFRYFPRQSPGDVDVGLLQLASGTNPSAVAAALTQSLPDDVLVLTREELIQRERAFWAKSTPTGVVFGLGLVVGFLVGVITCYQILFNDVTDNLPRFATLKALGYGDGYLRRVVAMEAVYLALLGFLPGLLASEALYVVLRNATLISMRLTPARVLLVAVLTLVMCLVAALFAVRKAVKADPAELF